MDLETALSPQAVKNYPLSEADGHANTLVFSTSQAASACIKSLTLFGGFKVCAKTVQGFAEPVQVADNSATSDDIFNLAVIAAASM